MRTIPLLLLAAVLGSCVARSDKYILAHAEDTHPCDPGKGELLKPISGPDKPDFYQGEFHVTTVSKLLADRDRKKPTFFMFFDSGCPGFPTTMPPYLSKVMSTDSITPVLIIVNDYSKVPVCRSRIPVWGWNREVYILDQDHYRCYDWFEGERTALVLSEFGIVETPGYHHTVAMEFLVNTEGKVIGYSNHRDLPHELRGKNLP